MDLVTGGSGYFGVNLTKGLLERGRSVRIFDIVEPPDEIMVEGAEFMRGDITDSNAVDAACNGVETVYHNVALVPLTRSGSKYIDVNVTGTRNVMEAALKNKVKSVVHLSTSAVYGARPSKGLIKETDPLKPYGRYGASKLEGEKICWEYHEKGLPVSIIRPRAIIGPGRLGIFGVLFDWLKDGKNLYIIGAGHNRYQMVSSDDLVDACILASEKGVGEVFNIGSDNPPTVREELEELIRYANKPSKVVGINATLVQIVLRILDFLRVSPIVRWQFMSGGEDFVFDTSKAKEVLGWSPKDNDAEMFKRAYDWFIENYEIIKSQEGTPHRGMPAQKFLKLMKRIS